MNVFIIPSWYPTSDFPITGIFIRDEVLALGSNFPDSNFGISLWGSHDRSLWLDKKSWYNFPKKFNGLIKPASRTKTSLNCIEYFSPALTWTRKVLAGNISGIIRANRENYLRFQEEVGNIDLIHAHVSHPAGVVAQSLSAEFNIPYLITEHMGPFPFESLRDKDGEPVNAIKHALSSSGAVIGASKFLCSQLAPYSLRRPIQIPNLVDRSLFSRKEIERQKKIIFIGRLEIEKGVQDLIDAWVNIAAQNPDWVLEFVGTGSLFESTNHNQIRWPGEMQQKDVVVALQTAAFLVLPSHLETFGKVLIEAMSVGVPVIATRCGGPEEIVDPHTGLLVPAHDIKSLSEGLVQMIDTYKNYNPLEIREVVNSRYASEVVTKQIMALYKQVSSARR